MSLSKDMEEFKFDVFSDHDYSYDMEQVDNKLGEWATKVAKLEEDAQILRTLRSQVEGFWKEYEEKREKERQLEGHAWEEYKEKGLL